MILTFLLSFFLMTTSSVPAEQKLIGAWKIEQKESESVIIFTESFFSLTTYNLKDKKFISTRGGSWKLKGKQIVVTDEFNTGNPEQIGKTETLVISFDENFMSLPLSGLAGSWKRVDDGSPGKLAGAWLITGRMVGNEMNPMTPGARRTMKILSGTRFQWIAYNIETKEFFGTGGGTYTTLNGKYTEHIEFFSRDASRVGMELTFDFSLDHQGNWKHKGASSKGDPIDEVWTKRERLGL